MAQYRITATEPTKDGTGLVAYDVWALDDDDNVIPGKHVTIMCPYDEVQDVISATPPAAQLAALKAMLICNKPATGWDDDALSVVVANNLNAKTVDAEFDELIDTAGGYPYTFSL